MLFYIENAGGNSDANKRMGPSFTTVAHGEHAHHQFRRFVVVREKSKEYYCYCWSVMPSIFVACPLPLTLLSVQLPLTAAGVLPNPELIRRSIP